MKVTLNVLKAKPNGFWSKITTVTDSGCWIWMGALVKGYAMYRNALAHRLTYQLLKGSIPEGMVLDHVCRVKCCVNPDHLQAVTQQVNCWRGLVGESARTRAKRVTHCPRGHEYSLENTYLQKKVVNGKWYVSRICKACNKMRQRLARRAA